MPAEAFIRLLVEPARSLRASAPSLQVPPVPAPDGHVPGAATAAQQLFPSGYELPDPAC
ncbi:hypothetical protein ACFPQ7_21950 [Methylobacterium iners]|uniref:hypothetical protein n=1 Tax=Methylobacterium iners TaxID=418707 RepID=UPI00361501D7